MMREEEALKKICHKTLPANIVNANSGYMFCLGSRCMLWVDECLDRDGKKTGECLDVLKYYEPANDLAIMDIALRPERFKKGDFK